MRHRQEAREAVVKAVIRLDEVEPTPLLDGRIVWPVELRVDYGSHYSKPHWRLLCHLSKKDGTRGQRAVEIHYFDFTNYKQDITPAWLPALIAEYAPRDLGNV